MKTNWNEPHKYDAFQSDYYLCRCGLPKNNPLHLDAEAKKGVKKLDALDACKRCDKLNHKIKCLTLELGIHMQKHKKIINTIGKDGCACGDYDDGETIIHTHCHRSYYYGDKKCNCKFAGVHYKGKLATAKRIAKAIEDGYMCEVKIVTMQKLPNLCTSCNRPIQKIGVMMPSANPKLRMRCLECASRKLVCKKFIPYSAPSGFTTTLITHICNNCGMTRKEHERKSDTNT